MESAKLFFRENPFPATPNPDRYVAIGTIENARVRLLESIDRREGPALLIGPAGTGKTLLCQKIAANYRAQYDVAFLSETRICTRKALLQHLLHHLGLPFSDRSEGELRLALIDRAASGGPDSRSGVLIIVDEAHTLPSRLLEELRMMSGIVRNGLPRVQLVLAGGPSLDERLSQPRMEALSQRIGARCYLHPLGQRETAEFVNESFRSVGSDPSTCIDDGAIQSVYYASSGIIRLINQTMSRALALAESIGRTKITGDLVERAWADLQQLPSPLCGDDTSADSTARQSSLSGDSQALPSTSIVEFGLLGEASINATAAAKSVVIKTAIVSDPMAETTDYEPLGVEENRSAIVPRTDSGTVTVAPAGHGGDDEADEEIDELLEEDIYAVDDLDNLFGDGFEDEQFISFGAAVKEATFPTSLSDLKMESSDQGSIPLSEESVPAPLVVDSCEEFVAEHCRPAIIQPASEPMNEASREYPLEDDIESALHDEIISINCDALSGTFSSFQHLASAEYPDDELQQLHAMGNDVPEDLLDAYTPEVTIDGSLEDDIAANNLCEACDGQGTNQLCKAEEVDELITIDDAENVCLPFSVTSSGVTSNERSSIEDDEVYVEERPRWSEEVDVDSESSLLMSDITVSDDSDMLIIEEDLEIDTAPASLAPRTPRSNDLSAEDADFQAIFAKLREG